MKAIQNLFAGAVLALASMSASAVLITESPYVGTDPGAVDTLLGWGRITGNDLAAETAFVNSVTGQSFTDLTSEKLCDSSAECDAILYATNAVATYAIRLVDQPAYFLLKTGAQSSLIGSIAGYTCNGSNGPGGDDCTHFVFQNLADLAWGVFNFTTLGFGTTTSISKISHVDQFGGTTTVPEPATLGLMGAGLVGLVLVRRRRTI